LTAADTVVITAQDWVPSNITQAEDRLHRIGQHKQVLVQHLVFDKSLDAYMAQTAVGKQEVADRALDERGLPVTGSAHLTPTVEDLPLFQQPKPAADNDIPDDLEVPF
jgi:SWI/SNF-related matrix-associated actin-dependent regulator 1 of chromatin subfamily A